MWYPGHIIPIIRIKITKDGCIPKNIDELNSLEYIQISSVNYEDRFLPINGMEDIKTQIERKSKYSYNVDEYGFLPEYTLELVITSKNQIKDKIKFIGNYKNAMPPKNEFIPENYTNLQACTLAELEYYVLDSYIGHNLKQYEFYNK